MIPPNLKTEQQSPLRTKELGTLGPSLSDYRNSHEDSPRDDNDEIYIILNTDNHYDLLDGKTK